MKILDIIFRCCDRSNQLRYISSTKPDLLIACLRSIVASVNFANTHLPQYKINIHVIDDHSQPTTIAKIRSVLGLQTVITQPYSQRTFQTITGTGTGASMRSADIFARDNCPELIYFIEDDYLHTETAIYEMLLARELFSANLQQSVILSPCDHATYYLLPDVNIKGQCRIVLGTHRHWRTVLGTTATYLIDNSTLKRYWAYYEKHQTYTPENGICENNTINLIYEQEFCFSPIPSLAAHVSHTNLQSPFFSFDELWTRYNY